MHDILLRWLRPPSSDPESPKLIHSLQVVPSFVNRTAGVDAGIRPGTTEIQTPVEVREVTSLSSHLFH